MAGLLEPTPRVIQQAVLNFENHLLLLPRLSDLADRGIRRVVLAPLFLARGHQTETAMPEVVTAAGGEHPGLDCRLTPPLGESPGVVEVLVRRYRQARTEGLKQWRKKRDGVTLPEDEQTD